ncbi:hypothetical protein BC332_12641 [Capsicum chinense]|nr:hypothetical protein BC332_12641 [Capsicum chinense]
MYSSLSPSVPPFTNNSQIFMLTPVIFSARSNPTSTTSGTPSSCGRLSAYPACDLEIVILNLTFNPGKEIVEMLSRRALEDFIIMLIHLGLRFVNMINSMTYERKASSRMSDRFKTTWELTVGTEPFSNALYVPKYDVVDSISMMRDVLDEMDLGHVTTTIGHGVDDRDEYPFQAKGVVSMPHRWCVFNGDTSNLALVRKNYKLACEVTDCTTLEEGSSCGGLSEESKFSYAFNGCSKGKAKNRSL